MEEMEKVLVLTSQSCRQCSRSLWFTWALMSRGGGIYKCIDCPEAENLTEWDRLRKSLRDGKDLQSMRIAVWTSFGLATSMGILIALFLMG